MIRRLVIAVLLGACVALIAVAGVHNLRQRRLAMQKAQQNEVNLTPASAAADPGADLEAKPLVGKPAPSFTLADINGKKVSLADFKGHPVVLNFWATYCGPCKVEMPWFQELQKKYQAQGLVVLGLDQDDGMATKEIADASRKIGVVYPILVPDDKVASSYKLSDYLPETYYIGKDGTVVEQTIGMHAKDELEADIQKAIGAGGA